MNLTALAEGEAFADPDFAADDRDEQYEVATIKVAGLSVIVDASLFAELSRHQWHPVKKKHSVYFCRREMVGGVRACIYMHRQICNAPANLQVDHIDRNTLNNRRSNLRTCTCIENRMNTAPRRRGCKGVKYSSKNCPSRPWIARIQVSGKQIHLGSFSTEREAGLAYDVKAKELFGKFAWLNYPESGDQLGMIETAYLDGLKAYAWYRDDGELMVGTAGTTFETAKALFLAGRRKR